MTILNPPQSVLTAKAQIALLREEIGERLAKAQATITELAAAAPTPEQAERLNSKAKGVAFVAGSHVEQILLFEGPSEVRRHCAELEDRIHTAGWDRGFVQGVDVALDYIRGYVR